MEDEVKNTEVVEKIVTDESSRLQSKNNEKTNFKDRNSFQKNGFKKDFKKSFKKFDNFKQDDFLTHLVSMRAVSKTRAGGRQRSFSVLMLAGNGKGLIGCGMGKSADVVDAIRKAERKAKKNVVKIAIKGTSVSHNVTSYFCGTRMIVRRVPEGTGMKAGGLARKVFSLAGITDVSCKCIGNSTSHHNVVYAVMEALKQTSNIKEISKSFGKSIPEILARRIK